MLGRVTIGGFSSLRHRDGYGFEVIVEQVDVDVERHRRQRVPERALYRFQVCAGADRETRRRVPQIVRRDVNDGRVRGPRCGQGLDEPSTRAVRVRKWHPPGSKTKLMRPFPSHFFAIRGRQERGQRNLAPLPEQGVPIANTPFTSAALSSTEIRRRSMSRWCTRRAIAYPLRRPVYARSSIIVRCSRALSARRATCWCGRYRCGSRGFSGRRRPFAGLLWMILSRSRRR